MAKIKVFGGRYRYRGKSVRAIVAATNQKDVAQTAGVSFHEVRRYWTQTANTEEIAQAMSRPGVLLVHRDRSWGPLMTLEELDTARGCDRWTLGG